MATTAAPSLDQLKATIRGAGLRSTAPRIAVLRRLLAATTPVSHGELVDTLADEGMDRTTVYRNLVDLTDAGLVQRTDLGDHVWRFELRRGARGAQHTEEHPHFVCVDCGGVSCLPGLSLKVEGQAKAPRSVTKNKVSIQLKGLCDDCS